MIRVLLLYGGRSSEHQISCLSASSVLSVIDRERYDVLPVGITRDGRWTLTDGRIEPLPGQALPEVADDGPTVTLVRTRFGPRLFEVDEAAGPCLEIGPVDVAFPVLHGPWGEDGSIQGALATAGVPYVGADVTASAIGIDKAVMKASFAARGLPQTDYVVVHRSRWKDDAEAVVAEVTDRLPLPWFIKPTRQGSSIGISKVDAPAGLADAMVEAFEHDEVVLVEEGLTSPRELEVGVLGAETIEVTGIGEIVPSHEFYDFDAKYLSASELIVPAEVDPEVAKRIDELARVAYRAIGCRGMARVDFFLAGNRLVLNEINTIPGFTSASMFPLLWANEGLAYPELVDRLLRDARV